MQAWRPLNRFYFIQVIPFKNKYILISIPALFKANYIIVTSILETSLDIKNIQYIFYNNQFM